jgi:hypothetical protein
MPGIIVVARLPWFSRILRAEKHDVRPKEKGKRVRER